MNRKGTASDFIDIEKGCQITILDIYGRVVFRHIAIEQTNVSNLPAGKYIINVTNESGSNCARFTISK